MKVTIEVTEKQRERVVECWGGASFKDFTPIDAIMAIKIARAIKKMERGK